MTESRNPKRRVSRFAHSNLGLSICLGFRISDFGFRVSRRRAFSLVEVAVSAVLVGVLMAAAMRSVGGSVLAQYRTAERAFARLLADGLLTEILAKDYRQAGSTGIGRDAGETTTSKVNYNDVDDFDTWTESPPQFADGTPMPDLANWSRSVQVVFVDPANLNQTSTSASETGAKRITVTVTHNGGVVATRVAVRTDAP
jgi:prepilin-type N-terminal cleavage/methylation domain-containing protein